jgi:DNA (cytosine-5)-methyltransferase 1
LGVFSRASGAFDLGFERAGFETVWQVEIDEYCRRVLERHFPRAERFGDIRDCGAHNLKPVDVICGGFPCQDISTAGPQHGIDGKRSGLWGEMRRIICELRPRFVIVENVSALLNGGLERVLGELAESGFDAEWDCLPAYSVGAPHRRDRVFICAYPAKDGDREFESGISGFHKCLSRREKSAANAVGCSEDFAASGNVANAYSERQLQPEGMQPDKRRRISDCSWWLTEPDVDRVAYGVPAAVDRIGGLGNAVVPQIAQWIAERIKAVIEQ